MKAILVIDMPKSCNECKFCKVETTFWGDVSDSYCLITKKKNLKVLLMEIRSSSCPLKDMQIYLPKPYLFRQMQIADGLQNTDGSVPVYSEDYMNGWNECIGEILGEINNEIT